MVCFNLYVFVFTAVYSFRVLRASYSISDSTVLIQSMGLFRVEFVNPEAFSNFAEMDIVSFYLLQTYNFDILHGVGAGGKMICDGGIRFPSDGGEVVLEPFRQCYAGFPNI